MLVLTLSLGSTGFSPSSVCAADPQFKYNPSHIGCAAAPERATVRDARLLRAELCVESEPRWKQSMGNLTAAEEAGSDESRSVFAEVSPCRRSLFGERLAQGSN